MSSLGQLNLSLSAEQCMLFASLCEYLYHQSRGTFARAMVPKIFYACFPAPR